MVPVVGSERRRMITVLRGVCHPREQVLAGFADMLPKGFLGLEEKCLENTLLCPGRDVNVLLISLLHRGIGRGIRVREFLQCEHGFFL